MQHKGDEHGLGGKFHGFYVVTSLKYFGKWIR